MYIVSTFCMLLFIYALYSWHKQNVCGHKLPPVLPGALPIIGHNHIIYFYRNDITALLKKVVKIGVKYGGVFCFYFVDQLYYGITDIEDAITVANAFSQKLYMYRLAEPWMGKGLLTASGPTFQSHRKLLKPAFSLSVTYGFLDVFNDESRRLTDIFDSFIGQGPVDTCDCFKNVTLRITCVTILGSYEKDKDLIDTFIVAMNSVLETIRDRFLNITLHNDFLYNFSSLKKKQDRLLKLVNNMTQETLEKRKHEMKNKANVDSFSESETGFRSFIDMLLEIASDGSLSDQEIKYELNTLVHASFETTSRQLVYIMVLLGTYPEMQEKVFKEVMEVVGNKDVEKEVIPKLVYTEAFIKESLRFVPVTNMLARNVDRDLKLKNYTLRAGSSVFIFNDGLHRQPAWGADSNEFRPERWLDKEKKLDNLNFAFGYGQRVCFGKKYAMVSMKVTIAHIVRRFRLKADFSKMKLKCEVLMAPKSGHEIIVETRN